MAKKTESTRRSLNGLIAEAVNGHVDVAGISTEPSPQEPVVLQPAAGEGNPATAVQSVATKKATTIMPKEVFNVLQMYCTQTDTPKHRAIYLFILAGLHDAGQISDTDYNRLLEMAELLTTTYEKK